MQPLETDVLIVGVGPAGVSAALSLRHEQLKVTLVDPAVEPTPRVESLPQNGILLAESIGLTPALKRACLGRASAMRLDWREEAELRDFGSSGPILLDRQRLHRALRKSLPESSILKGRARSILQRGEYVEVNCGAASIRARFVIDARGRARIRNAAGERTSQVALGFTGLNPVFTEDPLMMLASLKEGWLWCCLLRGHMVSGTLFLSAADLSGFNAAQRTALVEKRVAGTPLSLLAGLQAGPVTPAMLQAVDDPFAQTRILRIGDAALARDPISSHGLTHAFRSGVQGAAVAATVLDPSGETDAAVRFARDRHREAVADARTETTGSHAARATSVSQAVAKKWPVLSQPLALGSLRREAVLEGSRICWSQAIWLPNDNRAAAWIGTVSAAQLARLLEEPAPVAALSRKLEQIVSPDSARAILEQLLVGGALTPIAHHSRLSRSL